jgi:hypothetical protein
MQSRGVDYSTMILAIARKRALFCLCLRLTSTSLSTLHQQNNSQQNKQTTNGRSPWRLFPPIARPQQRRHLGAFPPPSPLDHTTLHIPPPSRRPTNIAWNSHASNRLDLHFMRLLSLFQSRESRDVFHHTTLGGCCDCGDKKLGFRRGVAICIVLMLFAEMWGMNNDDDEAVRVMQPRRMRGHISMRVNDVYRWRMKFAASSTELRTTKSIIDEERGSGWCQSVIWMHRSKGMSRKWRSYVRWCNSGFECGAAHGTAARLVEATLMVLLRNEKPNNATSQTSAERNRMKRWWCWVNWNEGIRMLLLLRIWQLGWWFPPCLLPKPLARQSSSFVDTSGVRAGLMSRWWATLDFWPGKHNNHISNKYQASTSSWFGFEASNLLESLLLHW